MHTPEQAKALWCPMVRIARREHSHPADDEGNTAIASGCNTDALGGVRVPASCRCIADKCAMWRWVQPPREAPIPLGDGMYSISIDENGPPAPTHGYCGLASTQAP